MKNLRKIVLLLLSLTLIFGLFACGGGSDPCTECTDSDGDGKCDECGEAVEPEPTADIPLIVDGEVKFQIVLGKNIDADVRKAVDKDIKGTLRNKHKIELTVVDEGSKDDTVKDVEILIGDITTRGDEYKFDRYSLGKDGYIIKMIGTKILIHGGSNESLADTIVRFAEEVLSIGENTLPDSAMTAELEKFKKQDNYKITSVAVNGTPLDGYVIATDKDDMYHYRALKVLQDGLYDRTGHFLPIVSLPEAGENAILIVEPESKIYGEESFNVKAEGTKLIMRCSFDNMLESAVAQFLLANITSASGDINFKNTVYTQDISVIYYEDFGAVGDGVTNDFQALYDAHVFANECGQNVKATKPGKQNGRYYISDNRINGIVRSITITTNVDWCGCEMIIDDRDILGSDSSSISSANRAMAEAAIFQVVGRGYVEIRGEAALAEIMASGINPSTTKIEINKHLDGWDGEVMIIPHNYSHNVYRRRGYGGYEGSAQHEVIVLDKDGNVSPETPIMFEYTSISFVRVYKISEDDAITIKNAKVTTRACTLNMVYYDTTYNEPRYNGTYIARNFNVSRSYTTVENVDHYVTDEIPLADQSDNNSIVSCGASYSGFYSASNANHVIFKDCVLSGRRCYKRPEGGTQGTYDIGASNVNKIVFEDCTQHNFWVTVDPETYEITPATAETQGAVTSMSGYRTPGGVYVQMFWGIGGTNYCKNMEYINSTLSRFDAHAGLYNGKIIGSTVNYLELIGNGEFIFEDSTWYQSSAGVSFMALREDYGYTWDGTIRIKNSRAFINNPSSTTLNILYHNYHNWYYGYTCAVPNLEIDNLMLYDISDVTGKKPVAAGTKVNIISSVNATSKFHLQDAGVPVLWEVTDADKDGFIDEPTFDIDGDGYFDEPTDIDGNGVIGNTGYDYATVKAALGENVVRGYSDPNGIKTNLNKIKPPEYIKIINNNGGYTYHIFSTDGYNISDGGWYRKDGEQDTMGGFWGRTKFIYGEGKDEYFLGSGHKKQTATKTFKFN